VNRKVLQVVGIVLAIVVIYVGLGVGSRLCGRSPGGSDHSLLFGSELDGLTPDCVWSGKRAIDRSRRRVAGILPEIV
jgi:hypothetical protein